MIEVRDLEVSFGKKTVLKALNIEINSGDFVIITGESGCGKTTLLNCLMLLENYNEGDIIYNGKSYSKMSNREKIKVLKGDFGIVFQDFGLIEDYTVYQNLKFVKRGWTTVKETLQKFKLSIDLHTKVAVLSGGEKQRLALARIALKQSKVIFCDEPTGNLDGDNSIVVMDYLKQMNEEGVTIVMVTHDHSLLKYANKHIKL